MSTSDNAVPVIRIIQNEAPSDDTARSDAAYLKSLENDKSGIPDALLAVLQSLDEKDRDATLAKLAKRRRRLQFQIPIKFVIDTLDKHVRGRRLIYEFLMYLVFFGVFLVYTFAWIDIEPSYWLLENLVGQCGTGQFPTLESIRPLRPTQVEGYHSSKSFKEVKNVQEWHDWLDTQVIQWFYEDANTSRRILWNNNVGGWNLKIGAIRLRVLRMKSSCKLNTDMYVPNGAVAGQYVSYDCYPSFSSKHIDKQPFGPPGDEQRYKYVDDGGSKRIQGELGFYPYSGHTFELPWDNSQEETLELSQTLFAENSNGVGFVDTEKTRFVMTEFFTYTPSIDTFASVKSYIEISVGGRFLATANGITFRMWSSKYAFWTAWSILFLLFVIAYVFIFIRNVVAAVLEKKLIAFCCSFWSWLDLVNSASFLTTLCLQYAWCAESDSLNFKMPTTTTPYPTGLDNVAWLWMMFLYFNALNVILCFFKLLRYTEISPQLNILSRTIASALPDLVGVLIIFLIIVISYALTGVMLFSNGMDDFKDVSTAISTLLRWLIGGFDYASLREENRFLSGVFFWTYTILALWILLNFLIGVLSGTFGDEREKEKLIPLHKTVGRTLRSVYNQIVGFLRSPKENLLEYMESRKSQYAARGKVGTVLDSLTAYRESLPLKGDLTTEEIARLPADKKEELMANPKISRAKVSEIIEMDMAEGKEKLAWLTARFLDKLWLDVYTDLRSSHVEEEENKESETAEQLEKAVRNGICYALGMDSTVEMRSTPEEDGMRQLFTISRSAQQSLEMIRSQVAHMENSMGILLHKMNAIRSDVDQMKEK